MSANPQSEAEAAAMAAAVKAGRLFFARPWRFVASVPNLNVLPPAGAVEVTFAGRSNVGKSSLINAITGQSGLARTSNTPGRTQELIFFAGDQDGFYLVDMPGYGYAKVSKEKSEAWTALVFSYLRGRPGLRRVYLLIDSRHGLKANDLEVLDLLDKAAVSYQVVLTKADKPKGPEVQAVLAAVTKALSRRPAAHPRVIVTSSETGAGMDELRAEIAALVPAPAEG